MATELTQFLTCLIAPNIIMVRPKNEARDKILSILGNASIPCLGECLCLGYDSNRDYEVYYDRYCNITISIETAVELITYLRKIIHEKPDEIEVVNDTFKLLI